MRRQKWDVIELRDQPTPLWCTASPSPCHRRPFTSGKREQFRKGSALVPPLDAQQPWHRSTATAWLWALVLSSGLVCPEHPTVLAAGNETRKARNFPSLKPESHQHQNLPEIHITEGMRKEEV